MENNNVCKHRLLTIMPGHALTSPDSARLDNAFPARWLVWLVALLFVFARLGNPGIANNDEGLYAEISREMLISHDWRH